MDMNSEDDTLYTAHYQKAIRRCMENEHCANQRCAPVLKPESVPSNNHFPSAMASGSGHSSFDPCDLSTGDEDYLIPNNVAKTTPG